MCPYHGTYKIHQNLRYIDIYMWDKPVDLKLQCKFCTKSVTLNKNFTLKVKFYGEFKNWMVLNNKAYSSDSFT